MDIESPKSLIQLIKALRIARFYDEGLISNICHAYRMLTHVDLEESPQIGKVYELSEIVNTLNYFAHEDKVIGKVMKNQLLKILEGDLPYETGLLVQLKFSLVRYLRYMCLFGDDDQDSIKLLSEITVFLLKTCQKNEVKVSYEDLNQLYQACLVFKTEMEAHIPQEVFDHLKSIWTQSQDETLITKFE